MKFRLNGVTVESAAEFFETFLQGWESMPKAERDVISLSLGSGLTQTLLMWRAVRHLRKGNLGKAQFYITWWVGTCVNYNYQLSALRKRASQDLDDELTDLENVVRFSQN